MTSHSASSPSRTRRVLAALLLYTVIIAVTLAVADGLCILFGILPPRQNPGDPELGWRPARPTGRMAVGQCFEYSTGTTIRYARNEDGVRTSVGRAAILADTSHLRIGVTGDSHTDLCATNGELHSGVLERILDSAGLRPMVLSYGAGRYSPLQAYLAFQRVLGPYRPQVLILNLYTGNDFYDILRSDDRPHFVATDAGYRVAPPEWYALDDPGTRPRSRVLYLLRVLAGKLGLRGLYHRVGELQRLGAQYGAGLPTVGTYMYNVWRAREPSVGYSDAFTAQMLNQQLFFHFFPGSEEESVDRVAALMALIREQYPDLLLVMSPLPSYELVGEQPVDSALMRALARLPITYDQGRQQEGALYERLRALAAKQSWVFVDNLAALQAYHGSARLYNNFDYHLLPVASEIVGRTQATAILGAREAQ